MNAAATADARTARAQWVLITPELAEKLLATHTGVQRVTSSGTVHDYATEMSAGRWARTAAPIQLDPTGAVLDGMHRLAAVVESGTSHWMLVVHDAPTESFPYLDIGKRRQAAQFLHKPNASRYAATAAVLAFPLNPSAYPRIARGLAVGTTRTLELAAAWEAELDLVVPLARKAYGATRIDGAMHGAVLAHIVRAGDYSDRIPTWIDGLVTGAALAPTDPRLHLRNRWLDQHRHLRYVDRRAGLFTIIRTWNAYAMGEAMRKLQVGEDITLITKR